MQVIECDNVVARGMAFLKTINPQWLDTIDLATLDVSAQQCCPLAQICKRPFQQAMRWKKLSYRQCEALGFMPADDSLPGYDTLTAAWGTAILKRRRENARKKMDRIAKAIIRGTPVEKPSRRHGRIALATRS